MADRGRTTPTTHRAGSTAGVIAAAAVHAFTASGIICALLATLAALDRRFAECFAWLGLALIIDGIDGTFARMVDVKRRLPRFSGERLDNVVDYVTYVFVPALALLWSGKLGEATGVPLAAAIIISSLYHFADNDSKTEDHCFVGFPAIWNVFAFYLFCFPLPVWVSGLLVLACVGLTFVPMRWLHPVRVERLFWLNMAATGAWMLAAAWTLWLGFPAPPIAGAVLLVTGLYMLALTVTWPLAHSGGSKAG